MKGMLTLLDLERLGKRNWREDANGAAAGRYARSRGEFLVRSADAGFEKRRDCGGLLFKEMHPVEKLKRIGLGTLID